MRKIEILDNVRLRFPGRDDEFDIGLEVGSVAVLMAQGEPFIERRLSLSAMEQLRPIAERFRYALTSRPDGDTQQMVSFRHVSRRPMLRVVS